MLLSNDNHKRLGRLIEQMKNDFENAGRMGCQPVPVPAGTNKATTQTARRDDN